MTIDGTDYEVFLRTIKRRKMFLMCFRVEGTRDIP